MKQLFHSRFVGYEMLLHLPTQMRFLLEENVSRAVGQNSLPTYSVGRTKLTNSLDTETT